MHPQMMNRKLSLKDKVVTRLTTTPECLDMREYSAVSKRRGTTFCLAGLILDESGVGLKYSQGIAVGLGVGEVKPASRWVDYEFSISAGPVERRREMIAARARELWAEEFGDVAAKLLPFYGPDWEVDTDDDLDQVTPERVVELLQVINQVAGELSAAL